MKNKVKEFLLEEYADVEQTGANEWLAYDEETEESIYVDTKEFTNDNGNKGLEIWGYNGRTNHKWLIGIID